MTFFKVLLAVAAVLWLISLIRIGGRVRYGQAGLFVTALAGPFRIQLLPMKPQKEKRQKKKGRPQKVKKPPKEAESQKEKRKPEDRPGTLSRLMKLLPVAAEACGSLRRKIRVDDLELELIWGGGDPAAVALVYGRTNAALGILWPIFDHNFKVKRHSFQIGIDYSAAQPAVEVQAAVTLTVGQIVTLGLHYGIKALFTWIKSGRPAVKRQEALSHE